MQAFHFELVVNWVQVKRMKGGHRMQNMVIQEYDYLSQPQDAIMSKFFELTDDSSREAILNHKSIMASLSRGTIQPSGRKQIPSSIRRECYFQWYCAHPPVPPPSWAKFKTQGESRSASERNDDPITAIATRTRVPVIEAIDGQSVLEVSINARIRMSVGAPSQFVVSAGWTRM
jgi:hypothetical protein